MHWTEWTLATFEALHAFEARPSPLAWSSALEANFIPLAFNSAVRNGTVVVTKMAFKAVWPFHSRRIRRALWTFEALGPFPAFGTLCPFAALHALASFESVVVIAGPAAALFREAARMMFVRPGERFDGVSELLAINHSIAIPVHRREERRSAGASIRTRTGTAARALFALVARRAGRFIGVLRVQVCHWQREPQCH